MQSRATLIITLAILASSALAMKSSNNDDGIHVICRPSDDGLVVFVAHPYECSKFFMCQGSNGIAMTCPGGLQFDANLNVCNYASVVGCVNTPYPTTSTEPMPSSSTTEEPETTTAYAEEEYFDIFV